MNLLGIYREPANSPGRHRTNDVRILELVGQALERDGVGVQLASLEDARTLRRQVDAIFSMCQSASSLAELSEWSRQGHRILNPPEAARAVYRDRLYPRLREAGLPLPDCIYLPTDRLPAQDVLKRVFGPAGAWLKRADVHAMEPGDVVHVPDTERLKDALGAFRSRGLLQAVLQTHIDGDEVKFYGVAGGDFFWPFYPKESAGYPFDERALRALAEQAAQALGLAVYGGDAIVDPSGHLTLIDLNDWPSFAPCRGAAACAIARRIRNFCQDRADVLS